MSGVSAEISARLFSLQDESFGAGMSMNCRIRNVFTMDLHEEDNLAEIYRRNRIEEDEFDRFKKRLSTTFIVSIAVILFASAVVFIYCTMQTIKGYFEKHPNTEWESKDPYIHVSIDENGKATSYMEIDGELVLVGFSGIGHNNITVIYKYNNAQQNSSNAKDTAIYKVIPNFVLTE